MLCVCVWTCTICGHGVGAQHICVWRVGMRVRVCGCVCGNGSWAGALGPEVGRWEAPRGFSALMASMPHLCLHSPLGCSAGPCGHQPLHEVT